ncbi:MAG: universal stress protein [Novosphingobium sp.]
MEDVRTDSDTARHADADKRQRVYLVIMDDTEEASRALRFAARRAVRTGGTVHILALVPKQEFVVFGSIQATIEDEARERAEQFAIAAANSVTSESGLLPRIAVQTGNGPQVVRDYLGEHPEVSALVLGAATEGNPGPLITHFTSHLGQLPCVLMIVPGTIDEGGIDSFS